MLYVTNQFNRSHAFHADLMLSSRTVHALSFICLIKSVLTPTVCECRFERRVKKILILINCCHLTSDAFVTPFSEIQTD